MTAIQAIGDASDRGDNLFSATKPNVIVAPSMDHWNANTEIGAVSGFVGSRTGSGSTETTSSANTVMPCMMLLVAGWFFIN